jgi:hypothetical protein
MGYKMRETSSEKRSRTLEGSLVSFRNRLGNLFFLLENLQRVSELISEYSGTFLGPFYRKQLFFTVQIGITKRN